MRFLTWVGLLLVGCSGLPQANLRIATGDSGEGLEPHRRLVRLFEQRHPGLRVQLEPVSGGDYYTRLLTQLAAGDPPDVVHLGDDALASFVQRQALLPLQPLQANDYLAGVLTPGAGYLVPKDFTPLVCYCNARLFRQAGLALPKPDWSWQDFVQLAVRLKADVPGPRSGFLEYLAALENADWSDFSGPSRELAVARLQELVARGGCTLPDDLGAFDGGLSNFEEGRAAMKISGRWPLEGLRQQKDLELVVLPPPRGSERANILYWSGLGVSKRSSHPELAQEYLQLASSSQGSRIWSGWALPARKDVAAETARKPFESVFLDEMPHLVERTYQHQANWGQLGGPALVRLHEAALLYPGRPAAQLLAEQAARLELERAALP